MNHTIKYNGVNIEDLSKKRLVELLKEAVLRLKVDEKDQQDARRYKWLRKRCGEGGEFYIKGVVGGAQVNNYIDEKIKEEEIRADKP